MTEITVMVRQKCRHGEVHPHSTGINRIGEITRCLEGDFHVYTLEDLSGMFASTLANHHPRMPIADVDDKAGQLVDALTARLREGAVA